MEGKGRSCIRRTSWEKARNLHATHVIERAMSMWLSSTLLGYSLSTFRWVIVIRPPPPTTRGGGGYEVEESRVGACSGMEARDEELFQGV